MTGSESVSPAGIVSVQYASPSRVTRTSIGPPVRRFDHTRKNISNGVRASTLNCGTAFDCTASGPSTCIEN